MIINRRSKISTSAELEIKDVIEDDIGKYSCVVKNYLGEVNSKTAELKIGMLTMQYRMYQTYDTTIV